MAEKWIYITNSKIMMMKFMLSLLGNMMKIGVI